MKKVFSTSSAVTHLWANQTQAEARTSNGNCSFDGTQLFSYSMMIACLRKAPDGSTVVFVNREARSNATSGHQLDALRASNQYKQFTYNGDSQYAKISWGSSGNSHPGTPSSIGALDIWNQYNLLFDEVLATAKEKRFSRTMVARLSEAQSLAVKANDLRELFNLDVPTLASEPTAQQVSDMGAYIARQQEIAAAKKAAVMVKTKADREAWMAGVGYRYPDANELDICLRLNPSDPTEVQTSRGATVPTKVCRRLWVALQDRQMPADQSVGVFHLDKIGADGLTIGCHLITTAEANRFAAVLWPDQFA